MDLLSIIAAAAGIPADKIIAILRAGATKFPDWGVDIEGLIAKITAPLSPENLAAVGSAAIGEVANILKGQIDPKEHPSDGA